MHKMGFLTHFTIFVLVVNGLSNVASHRLEIPDVDQRAPGTSEERQGESTRTPPGESAETQQLVVRGYDERLVHGRSKRDLFIVPGTKWCGPGNSAANYDDLGAFEKTDICCRDHDHCPYNIAGRSTRYGLTNREAYTMSWCRCDDRFHRCLKQVDNNIATSVGHLFFNAPLDIQCFQFPRCDFGTCPDPDEDTAHIGRNRGYHGGWK